MIGSDLFRLILDVSNDSDLKDAMEKHAKGIKAITSKKGRSVASLSKNLILQYPCLFSNDCAYDTIEMITRAMEHEYTTMLLLVVNDAISASGDKTNKINNVSDFLAQYHTNITANGDNALGTMNESYKINFHGNDITMKDLCEACITLLNPPENLFNEDVLNESNIPCVLLTEGKGKKSRYTSKNQNIKAAKEREREEIEKKKAEKAQERARADLDRRTAQAQEAIKDEVSRSQQASDSTEGETNPKDIKKRKDKTKQGKGVSNVTTKQPNPNPAVNAEKVSNTNQSNEKISKKEEKKVDKEAREAISIGGRQAMVNNMDFKKINNLSPTIVTFDLIYESEAGNLIKKPAMFGVKAVAHQLNSNDVRYYLSDTVKDKFKLFRFIQWTTGEIKLVKDLILNASSMKKMAVDTKHKNTFWWRKLSSLAEVSKIKTLMSNSKNMPVATSTMVITMNDVNAIKAKNGIDFLNNIKAVNKIIETYFLLGFIIVDESSEVAYIYNDSSKSFNYYSYNSLSKYGKEKAKNDNPVELLKSLLR
jgi:hypothetical protein